MRHLETHYRFDFKDQIIGILSRALCEVPYSSFYELFPMTSDDYCCTAQTVPHR